MGVYYLVQSRDDDGEWTTVEKYLLVEDAEAKAEQGRRLGETVRIVSDEFAEAEADRAAVLSISDDPRGIPVTRKDRQ
jgi:hypothetical protein